MLLLLLLLINDDDAQMRLSSVVLRLCVKLVATLVLIV